MILSNVKKRIIVNAGHHNTDPGAISATERDEVKLIRDHVVVMLRGMGFEVIPVPDDRDLPQSIAFANIQAPSLNDGLCIDIHLNSSTNTDARGTEAYHLSSPISRKIAETLSFYVSDRLGIPNRGAKLDTLTHAGSLGWLRKTKALATLVEVCFISNKKDMEALTSPGGYRRAAQGIADAVLELYGGEPKPTVADAIKKFEEGLDILKKI